MHTHSTKAKALLLCFTFTVIVGACLLWFGLIGNVLAQSNPADPVIHAFTINNGDSMTGIHEVTLQLSGHASLEQFVVRYRNSGQDWHPWEPFQAEREWLLSAGDGLKQVDVEIKNQNDDISTASATIQILVPVDGVTIDWSYIALRPNDPPLILKAEVFPQYASNRQVTWSSSNPAVAVVSEGLVTPVSVGSTDITVTTVDGAFSATCRVEVSAAPQEGIDPSVLYGDVTGTGEVDVGDAILILRSIVELVTLSPKQRLAADVNLDGLVDVGDAIIVLRYIVGLVPSLPVGHAPQPPDEDPPAPDPPAPPVLPSEAPTQRLLNAQYRVSPTAQVAVSALNVRSGPGTQYRSLGTISLGQRFIIREEAETADSQNNLWFRINYNGQAGWISAKHTSVHIILYGLDYWSNPTRLTDAPPGLAPGNYKIDSQYRFFLNENGSLTSTNISFDFLEHIPYARLPLERPAPAALSAAYLAQSAQRIRPDSPFPQMAASFIQAQELWGVNAMYLMAHAALESSWGTSLIARDKKNIFGYMAFDNDPYASAATFRSMEDSVLQVSGFIRRAYLSEGGFYFKGPHLVGMNEFYATDPMWAVKIARTMQSIYSFSDYTAVEKELNQGIVTAGSNLNLRGGAGTNFNVITSLLKDTAVKISGARLVSGINWLKVSTGSHSGWASGEFISLRTRPQAAIYFADWYKEGNAGMTVNVRGGPGTEHPVVFTLPFGNPVEVLAMQPVLDQSDGKWYLWYQVTYPDSVGQNWVRGDCIIVKW